LILLIRFASEDGVHVYVLESPPFASSKQAATQDLCEMLITCRPGI